MIGLAAWLHGLKEGLGFLRAGRDVAGFANTIGSRLSPNTKGKYLRQLRQRLGAMPFIYHGAEGVILSDYVPAALRAVHLITLEVYHSNRLHSPPEQRDRVQEERDHMKAIAALRSNPRALFLADAGMGKTTFFSYVAVTLTLRKALPAAHELFGPSRPIPIFVPLKVLDNATARPILTYIRALPFFSGDRGFRRLVAMARQGKLLLLLDGYDEIYVAKDASSIKMEIDSLFSATLEELPGDEDSLPGLTDLYRSLYKNRVWLSSRREHYMANRLRIDLDNPARVLAQSQIAVTEVMGLKSRRDLVKRIFDRSRVKSDFLRDELSEDAFFGFLARTLDDETTALSRSPLFLTIICYLYIKGIETHELEGLTETLNLRSLVLTCIRLLLSDLDEFRVRGLPNRIRAALKERRSLYVEEKFDFLCFLSYQLLTDQRLAEKQAFTESTIREIAQQYFSRLHRNAKVDDILRNLDSSHVGSIVRQLILQGIFVLVDKTYTEEFFDFAHRRFREILATKHFDTAANIGGFFRNIASPHFREFVIVMFRVSPDRRDQILEILLANPEEEQNGGYSLRLARTCLETRPEGYDPSAIVEGWTKRLRPDPTVVSLVPEMLKFVNPSLEFVAWADRSLVNALALRDSQQLMLFGTILHSVRASLLFEHVSEALEGADQTATVLAADLMLSLDPAQFVKQLLARETENSFRLMARALLEHKSITGREQWWKHICRTASDSQLAALLGSSLKYNVTLAPRVLGFQRLNTMPSIAELQERAQRQSDGVFVISDTISDLVEDPSAHGVLLLTSEGIFTNLDHCETMIPSLTFEQVADRLYPEWKQQQMLNIYPSKLLNVTKAQAEDRRRQLDKIGRADFMEQEADLIQAERDSIRCKLIGEIRDCAQARMHWPQKRWMSFLELVVESMQSCGVG
jgi:hypothetical protein